MSQLTRGMSRRVMYVENKHGLIDGAQARIGWVTFSKSGKTVYYRGRSLMMGSGISGNFIDEETREEYWVSGVKKRGSNAHPAGRGVKIEIDVDAMDAYLAIRKSAS